MNIKDPRELEDELFIPIREKVKEAIPKTIVRVAPLDNNGFVVVAQLTFIAQLRIPLEDASNEKEAAISSASKYLIDGLKVAMIHEVGSWPPQL